MIVLRKQLYKIIYEFYIVTLVLWNIKEDIHRVLEDNPSSLMQQRIKPLMQQIHFLMAN